MKLFNVDTIEEAEKKLLEYAFTIPIETEMVDLSSCEGRILAEDIFSSEDIPSFYRSTVDGYAVKSQDTAAATENIPVFLKIADDIKIGEESTVEIKSGQCAYVPTGGMLPKGADAMVMIEYTELLDETEVAVQESVAFGKSVVKPGEDVKFGQAIAKKGTVLDAFAVGALANSGNWFVKVFKPIKVAIISTGDELVEVSNKAIAAKVRDVNTWSLMTLAKMCKMEVVNTVLLKDDEELFEKELEKAKNIADIVLTSGGSSQGKKDMTCFMLDKVCDKKVFTHGLSLKPGKPTILAFDENSKTLMIGLPGHPVAALTVFQLLIVRLMKTLFCIDDSTHVICHMETNVASAPGKTTCIPVKIKIENNMNIAIPIIGKSGLINAVTEADGYILVDRNKEGLKKGEMVAVHRFGL